jgi:uncharacterized protein with NAD-binding domain and iron-sulfur cluster
MIRGRKKKIAIVGGGYAALSAAFRLIESNENLEVSVYTPGWRLGGQSATSRCLIGYPNPKRPYVKGFRIEEKHPQFWDGAYHESFSLIQRVYDYWRPGDKLAWKDCFDTASVVDIPGETDDTVLSEMWRFDQQPAPGKPGDFRRRSVGESLFIGSQYAMTGLRSLGMLSEYDSTRSRQLVPFGLNDWLMPAVRYLEPVVLSLALQMAETVRMLIFRTDSDLSVQSNADPLKLMSNKIRSLIDSWTR